MTFFAGGGYAGGKAPRTGPAQHKPKVHNHGPAEGRGLDCPERLVGACMATDEQLQDRVVELELANQRLQDELQGAQEKLRRAGVHLRLRTSALARVIARERRDNAIVVGTTAYFPGRVRQIVEEHHRRGW